MASSKDYLNFILEQLSLLPEITYRSMMGEYVLYYRGRIFGYVCDDRFLVKPVPAARARMPEAELQEPYPGAKPMLLADNLEDREFLRALVEEMYPELPEPKPKKKKKAARE